MRSPSFLLASAAALVAMSSACSDETTSTTGSPSTTASSGGGGSAAGGGTGGSGGAAEPCALGDDWQLVEDYFDGATGETQASGVAGDGSGALFVNGTSELLGWIVRKSDDGGTSWANVLEVPLGTGAGIAVDAAGTVYAAGSLPTAGTAHRILHKSSDGGASWQIVDDFSYDAAYDSYGGYVTVDAAGVIFTAGNTGSSGGPRTVVRKSDDGGATWSTELDFQLAAGKPCIPRGLAAASNLDLYLALRCVDAADLSHSLVQRSTPGGTWSTVDDLPDAQAGGLFVGTSVYLAGRSDAGEPAHWIVRRAALASDSFSTLDDFGAGTDREARSLYEDGTGAITVVGLALDAEPHVLTRRSSDGGASWQIVDDFSYGTAAYLGPLAADPAGNLYNAGIGIDTGGLTHWLLRRMSCR